MAAKKLPPIPKTVWSQLGPIAVVFVDDLEAASEAYGCWSPEIRTIKLSPRPCLAMQWATFYHECVHAWLWDAGTNLNEDVEERVADAIGSALTAAMLD
jgi:hypothetical protein